MRPASIDETLTPEPLSRAVPRLALAKAHAARDAGARGVVVAADTVVAVDDVVLGKPVDAPDARRMLRLLRDRAHDVVSGVAVLDTGTGRETSRAVLTGVVMGRYDDEAIEAYVLTGSPFDKAGAYAIQEIGDHWVTSLSGPYSNVVGLPLGATREMLEAFGVPLLPPSDLETRDRQP